MKCGGEDSLEHLLTRVDLAIPRPSGGPHPTIIFLVELARRARWIHSRIPVPGRRPAEADFELSLIGGAPSGTEEVGDISLNPGGGTKDESGEM